ncbi:MAG: flagellar basal body rod protein FlgF [Sphingomonadaceae bacterium]
MDRLIYTALTGMQRAEERQQVTANNLANAQTPGFRREMAALATGWLQPGGAALSSRVQSGGEAPHDLLETGRVETTGNTLDIALDGGAWLAVGDQAGEPALTRRGDLRLDAQGQLLTGDGRPVLGEDGPIRIAIGNAAVRIDRTGEVQTKPTIDGAWVPVARLRLVSPDPATLNRGADGLFRSPDMDADPLATVTTGALERSNVQPTTSLIELIEQSRAFEVQTKLLSAAREMDEGTAALMRVE